MSHQVALTVWARIQPGMAGDLDGLLRSQGAALLPFDRLAGVHFARLLIVADGARAPGLLFTMDVDAPLERRLRDLVDLGGEGLDQIFCHCEGYPPPDSLVPASRMSYLRAHLVDVTVFYAHVVGRSLDQVRQEAGLRDAIEDHLDRTEAEWRGRDAREVRQAIRSFVEAEPSLCWALAAPQEPEPDFQWRERLHMVAVPLVLVVLLPLLVPAVLVWLAWLRLHEVRDPAPDVALDPRRLGELRDMEDYGPQNQISTLSPIKPGAFWRLTAWVFLSVVADYISRHVFTRGSLSGLRTVHFARFMVLGRPRRVLFTSYYDGDLESYNNDFIDKVAWVLNGVFGNESGYPQTRWLFGLGARNEAGFKAFLRGHQIPTQAWYSAYPDLTAINVDANARLRAGLRGDMSESEARAWLQLL
jgi:hypothetical protein